MAEDRCSTCETVLDGNAHNMFTCQRCGIHQKLENSSLRGLVPLFQFEIIGDEIEFIPNDAFWQHWRVDACWLSDCGVRVYSMERYRRPKPSEWRVRVRIENLDTLTTCATEGCDTDIATRSTWCTACWPTQRERRNIRHRLWIQLWNSKFAATVAYDSPEREQLIDTWLAENPESDAALALAKL